MHESSAPRCSSCGFAPVTENGFPMWAPDAARSGDGFKAEYFAELARLESGNFWFRGRNDLIAWALRRHFPEMRSFLEVGCGTGFVLAAVAAAYPEARLAGSELFGAGLPFAASRVPRASFMQMDARHLPYDNEFDVIGAFDVIEHIEEDERVLASLARALRPGGGLLVTVPQHRWLWSASDDYACHVRRYSATELHRKVRAAGFTLLRSTSFVSFLLPAMLASRKRAALGAEFDPLDELRIHPAVNRALEWILRAEALMIRAGVSFPLGGSRLLVARRADP